MEKEKKTYHLAFQCTKQSGVVCRNKIMHITATSEAEAKRIVKKYYPDAKDFRFFGKSGTAPRKTSSKKETVEASAKVTSTPKTACSFAAERKTPDVPHIEPEEIVCSVWNKRKAEMARLQEQLEADYSRKLSDLTSNCEAKRKKLNKELELTKKTIAEKTAYRKTLGLFQFEKRKAAKMEIVKLKDQQEALSRELQALDDHFHAEKFDLKNEKAAEKKRLYQRAKENIPAPKTEYYTGYSREEIEQQVRLNRLIYLLLEMEPGKRYTITDMLDFPGLSHCTNSAILSLFRLPAAQSYIVRTVEQGRAYYTLNIL